MKLYILTDPDLILDSIHGECEVFHTIEEANARIKEGTKGEGFAGYENYEDLATARSAYRGNYDYVADPEGPLARELGYWYNEDWDNVRLLEVEVPWLQISPGT